MSEEIGINQLIKNFDNEVNNKEAWVSLHMHFIMMELCEIRDTLYIYKTAKREWDSRVQEKKINYSRLRTTLYNTLPYRIILGLSKIFIGSKEYSLLKTLNILEQMTEFKNNQEVKATIDEIREYLDVSELIKMINIYRDKFFAHLDKVSVISDCRIDTSIPIDKIEISDINLLISLFSTLNKICFNNDLRVLDRELLDEDINYTFFWMCDN